MKITKFQHSCLLVEMPEPFNRTTLFDPGVMSEAVLDVSKLQYLDDIVITHVHADHVSVDLLKKLVAAFPEARITAPTEVVTMLAEHGIQASNSQSEGIVFFESPHENVQPLFPEPEQHGIHYLQRLTHPGDSHSFTQTMPILALPIAGPWASLITGLNLAIHLRPQYVLPIHDWHLNDQARSQLYGIMAEAFQKEHITFVPLVTAEPVVIDV